MKKFQIVTVILAFLGLTLMAFNTVDPKRPDQVILIAKNAYQIKLLAEPYLQKGYLVKLITGQAIAIERHVGQNIEITGDLILILER